MFARRDAAEKEITGLIGQLVFDYSRFVTALHFCVAWHNQGKDLDTYSSIAEDLDVADLLRRIEKQALNSSVALPSASRHTKAGFFAPIRFVRLGT